MAKLPGNFVFVDASYYIALLNSRDTNHNKALAFAEQYSENKYLTSYAILGEVLTVGSQRYSRQITIRFAEKIMNSSTVVVLEEQDVVDSAFRIFEKIKNKNVSWVDCYSFAIMKKYRIRKALSFDLDFQKFLK